ncbi:hypothetical protein N7494_004974 [Penicillium frequentans]|uniref:F-box domain-containing protein n=1 Tax=Penicillium frequentans TaxID=3151616 RepID=A0AAD6D2Q2_9EURO|nr:hypothetical protein N7494_004974 [Penicillium glabrum]
MQNLQDLPVELLKAILSFLLPREAPQWEYWADVRRIGKSTNTNAVIDDDLDEDGSQSLYNMCLVSKRFRDIAQPLLFLDFLDDGVLGNIGVTVQFAKILSRRPELGQFVQDITFEVPLLLAEYNDIELELSGEEIELFTKEIKDLKLGDMEDAWIRLMRSKSLEIFAALILNKTPNVRRLIIPGGTISMNFLTGLFRQNSSFLHKLESIGIMGKEECSFDIGAYHEFLTLPNLKLTIVQYGDLQSPSTPGEPILEPGSLNVEELVFRGCGIDAASIKTLTRACTKLKSFSLDNFTVQAFAQRAGDPSKGSQFNASHAHEALMEHKGTLECLRLDFARDATDLGDWQRFLSSRAKMASLRDFSVLEDIRLQQAIVPVHPQLPAALKRLTITDCNSSVINLVKNVAKDCKKGLYPDFVDFTMLAIDITQPIQLPGQIIPKGKTPEQAHRALMDLFQGTKVDFLICPFRMPGIDPMMHGLDDDYDEDWEDDDDDDYFDDDDLAYDSEGYEIEDPIMDALRAARSGRGGAGGGGPNGPMPEALLNYFMQRAMQDPDFAPFHPPPATRRPR